MQAIYNVLDWINGNILWGIPMIVLILLSGIVLSIRSKFLQVRKFGASMKHAFKGTGKQVKNKEKGDGKSTISAFEAFSTAISGTVGTGNIVGVTTAILSGGPGAVLWMWISAFFGCVTKFSEITLGLFYRKKNKDGEYIGGPMYYIEKGTGQKWLAVLFAIFAILAAVGMGSVQADTIQNSWKVAFSIPTWVTALIIAFFTALVVIGGIKRIGKVTSFLVPFMIIIFLALVIVMICINITAVPVALASIFTSAFTTKSMVGGFMGYGIASAMRYGFARGIFSNEAGLGSSPIAHSMSATKEPVEQGLWGIFEVFVDTFVICTLTALFVLTSGIDGTGKEGSSLAMSCFSNVFGITGTIAYNVILPLFAYSTILAWALYGSKASEYLFPKHEKSAKIVFGVLYITLLLGIALITFFFGNNLGSRFVWLISDMTNALMAIPNLVGLVLLSGTLIKITKNYFDRKKNPSIKPLVSAYDDENDFISDEIIADEKSGNENAG